MRARNLVGVVAACLLATGPAAPAWADKQIDELTAGYEKEAAACSLQLGGVAKVADGAAALQASLAGAEHDALDADVGKLAHGKRVVEAYCAELASALEVLHANAGGKYKALERQLDDHDNKIRRARADAKKAIAEVEPLIHALVPRINARVQPAEPAVAPRAAQKFPSGRTVLLPALPGQWRLSGTPTSDTADYSEAGKTPLAASVWTRPFDAATCEQEKRAAVGAELDDAGSPRGGSAAEGRRGSIDDAGSPRGGSAAEGRRGSIDESVADAAGTVGVAWTARGVVHDGSAAGKAVVFACLPDHSPPGGWMGYVTVQPEGTPALREALEGTMLKMLAAQAGTTPHPVPEPHEP